MMQLILLVLTGLGSLLLSKGAVAHVNYAEAQIEWIRSKGGFFSPKLEIQLFNKTDPDSPSGVFATQDVSEQETLMVIPRSCLLTSEGSSEICDTAQNLMKQRKLKDKSEFAPYVNHIFDPKHKGQVPAAWSEAGKELLKTIIGNELPPEDVTDVTFEEKCGGSGDPFEEESYLTVVRRSWDDKMLPVFDMCNHRNGRWFNVDSNSAHEEEEEDITVFARRDIKAGEQLYLSYNECADCDFALTYVLQDILKDFGFVEQYPRRWRFSSSFGESHDLVFELDEEPDTGSASTKKELKLTWLSDPPDDDLILFLRGHLRRLRDLSEFVSVQAEQLDSNHERDVSLEFYQALMTALEHAIWATDTEDMEQKECIISANGDPGTCVGPSSSFSDKYDELEEPSDIVDSNQDVCSFSYYYNIDDSYESIDHIESQYTEIDFRYSKEMKDTCLYLNDFLHACASFRPHYHEVFVHYPARFLDEVKRVAFIGGGDNMIVHEILKYPSLELVVGMELDQEIVRSSFKNFGTQPHWDNEKVQWWYGDGSKSILMLPKEYFGTFDLVLLDLQTDVVDILKVAGKHDIMDAALLLLKPDGVIARNEDWYFGTNEPFTVYTIDLFYVDVPVLCHQGITVGSNTVDFLTRTPKDHKIETVYLKAVDETEDRFDMWYNYRKSSTQANRLCKEWPEQTTSSPGVLMILEAEDAAVPLESSSSVQAGISKALKNAGLAEISVTLSSSDEEEEEGYQGYEIVFILREGYAVARTWPEHKYCAFDLLLWSSFEKLDAAKTELITAVASKSPSSYRIIMGDMFGISKEDWRNIGPRANESCKHPVDLIRDAPAEQSAIDTVLGESSSLIQDTNNLVAVLCGEQSRSCSSLGVLAKNDTSAKVIPVWTCPRVTVTMEGTKDASQHMFDCESDTLRTLNGLVEANGKIAGIVIDPEAPRAMGQVLHKVLNNTRVRRELLIEDYVVLATTLDPSESWRRALLDRFRTDFAIFDPAYRAEIFFNSTSSSLELGVFSSGDSGFYSHLVDMIARIENKTGLVSDVRNIQNGVNNYVPDFEPSKTCSHDDYDHSSALEQWLSQTPLGKQTIFQFAMKTDKSPLSTTQVKEALLAAVVAMDGDDEHLDVHVYDHVRDGCIIVAFGSEGSAILLWDGRAHVCVNLFTDTESDFESFVEVLVKNIPVRAITSRDDLPRGFGRVVNFQKDIGSRLPHWA